MCCSKLIKTFDFLSVRACVCLCVSPGTTVRAHMLEEQGWGLLRCVICFFNLVILITVHIYLHSLFVFCPR